MVVVMELKGYTVRVRPLSVKFSTVLYVKSDEAQQIPDREFFIIELDDKRVPAAAHKVNKNCLMLTLLSKKKTVKEIKKELKQKMYQDIEVTIYPF